ncbi:ureidoglycolate lyase [Clostridium homopropionicum DSM 5847]|uniref:Ureidoglycolate lyase n=1 Tax=Clostridium homopropionicum DSM 5847 TaxID=1121318 RepID=A0A0L6ZEV9_9CLOT|nr:ureidoglycolate lyase [Clostridium homopropionicum DSM 5847]SFG07950.1 2-keto-4-pentenoate hydratase/2-oxohepta-3-ene-1,7-dioic acid hydratase (catechol pathway) [Clostridium homopropionicum]
MKKLKFVTFYYKGIEQVGLLSKKNDRVYTIKELLESDRPNSMIDFIEDFNECVEKKLKYIYENSNNLEGIDISKVKLLAPIPEPRRGVICLGKNYAEHVNEVPSAIDFRKGLPENPIYFCKLVDRAIEDKGSISIHKDVSKQVDYEVELAVIIGKKGRDIPKDKVEEYVFGYTILNDISLRDIQAKHIQWFKGKSFDGTCPMGPCIVHKSEIKLPVKLDIKCYVNGELRQNSNTSKMIFDIPYIISEFSKGTTLKPGDIISTGTPSGVGMGFKPPKLLKVGDEIMCYIEKIGTLTNIVEDK